MHVIRTRGPEISGKERKAMTSGELMMMTNGCLSIDQSWSAAAASDVALSRRHWAAVWQQGTVLLQEVGPESQQRMDLSYFPVWTFSCQNKERKIKSKIEYQHTKINAIDNGNLIQNFVHLS